MALKEFAKEWGKKHPEDATIVRDLIGELQTYGVYPSMQEVYNLRTNDRNLLYFLAGRLFEAKEQKWEAERRAAQRARYNALSPEQKSILANAYYLSQAGWWQGTVRIPGVDF